MKHRRSVLSARALPFAPLVMVMVLVIVVAVVGSAASAPVAARQRSRGQAIFVGDEPLSGAIRGHRSGLPAEVVRCSNCHAIGEQAQPRETLAPRIDRSLLLEARERRGGPPSSYDSPTFCRLMRTGVDPAYVLIAREMPVYELADAQCAALWRFLTEETARDGRK